MTSISEDLALPILKQCFLGAANVRIVHHQVEDGQRHGTSDVTRFVVEYKRDDKIQQKHLVMKVPISNQQVSSLMESLNIYSLEINMYENVLPRINKYLDENLSPAHLYTTDSKILVLEDLTVRGYKSGEKLPLLNLVQTKAIMKAYACFHSASYKLHLEDPLIVENSLHPHFEDVNYGAVIRPWRVVVLELLRRKKDDSLLPKVEAAISYLETNKDKFLTISDKSNFKFVVLSHGDSRKENCLFKQETNDEWHVKLIDYQCCFWSSPAYDVSLFLSSSVSADVMEAHFDDLIRGYLHELNERLGELECGRTYERADFDKDFITLKFFFFFGFFVLCGTNTPVNRDQLLDIVTKSMKGTNQSYENLCDICLNDEQFVRVVYRWLKYFEKINFFDQF